MLCCVVSVCVCSVFVCAMMCGNICSYFCSNSCRCCCWLLVLSSQTAALTLNTSTHNTHTHSHSHTLPPSPSELRVERSLSLSKQRFHWDSLLQLNKYLNTLKMTRCLPRLVSSTQLHHLLTWAIDIDIEMSIELQIIKDNAPRIIVAFYSRLYGYVLWPFALRLIAIYSWISNGKSNHHSWFSTWHL